MKKGFYTLLQVIFLAVFVFSATKLIDYQKNNKEQDLVYEDIQSRFEMNMEVTETTAFDISEQNPEIPVVYEKELTESEKWADLFEERKEIYQSVQEENPDMTGWIHIDGTTIDYPVCFTPDDPEYYLHRNIYKQESAYGVPFILEGCDPAFEEGNIAIAGHHMKNGSMFAPLMDYTEKEFYETHKYIHFDTVEAPGTYEVVSVISGNADSTKLPWQDILFAETDEEFCHAWEIVEREQFYDTGTEVTYGDKLLILVTCEYTHNDGRLLVIAKEVS